MTVHVLYCGDTQVETLIAAKGFDTFTHTYFRDSSHYLRDALAQDDTIHCQHMGAERVREEFPMTLDDMRRYDCIILSDVGYNNLALLPGNRPPFKIPMGPDRVSALREYVSQGGGLIMVGGWLSFSGLEGKGIYSGTPVEDVLPVTCERGLDDREEIPDGVRFDVRVPEHPIMRDLRWSDDYLILGYNRVFLRDDAELLASLGEHPGIATRTVSRGRSLVFTPDVTTHWAGSFLTWADYAVFWQRVVKWTAGVEIEPATARDVAAVS